MSRTVPTARRGRRVAILGAALALLSSGLIVPTGTAAAVEDRWSGRWDVEGTSTENGPFSHFGVLTLEVYTDGPLDHGESDSCADTDVRYVGTYKYGGGGTFEACEIAELDYGLYGKYFDNDGSWGHAHMDFTPGSPATFAGYYSPPTTGTAGVPATLKWRGTKLPDGCAAPGAAGTGTARQTDDEQDCSDPVIFIPGFLGSEIGCPKSDFFDELWPDSPTPEFLNMRLDAKGTGNFQGGNKCNRNAESGPIIERAFGFDVYRGIKKFLRSLPGVKSYFFSYDWRKSPGYPETQEALDRLVKKALDQSGREKVTLVAHSMGGLVARWYVGSNRAKVARVVTMGTPYWGAPKPWLALAHGVTGPPNADLLPDLDSFIPDDELKAFAVNAFGAYFLYPSPAYYEANGGWLFRPGTPFNEQLDQERTLDAVRLAGGNRELYRKALAAHSARLDNYAGGDDLDWQMIVGTGTGTLTQVTERGKTAEDWLDDPDYSYGNGDGTVPKLSAAQGQTDDSIVHYVCGVEHASLPGNEYVQGLIKDFILTGGPIVTTCTGHM